MSRSSEEVLLVVNSVRHKKSDGSLYMMGERVAWMQAAKDTFTVSHHYADIKSQRISPDSKEKVQLQVILHDGGADTFQFTNKDGRDAQVQDRNGVKELLQNLLPKFRIKVNSELEQKNRMLQEDPELFQLYKDLVVSGVVSPEEFWANRAEGKKTSSNNHTQQIGVSAAFLADIKPQTDGSNGIKYNITPDIIEAIFKTYPAVQRKHADVVPHKHSEAEFWTRFFQSHYFHRDRLNFTGKDLFAECAKNDDEVMKAEVEKKVGDQLVDLTTMSDVWHGDGYGQDTEERVGNGSNPVNASLIRRFNQHSTMVLKVCTSANNEACSASSSLSTSGKGTDVGPSSSCAKSHENGTSSLQTTVGEPPPKKARLREKVELEDLGGMDQKPGGPALKLRHLERFLQGPTLLVGSEYNTTQDVLQACQSSTYEVIGWRPKLDRCLQATYALSILGDLSPGGKLMKGHTQQQLHEVIPSDIRTEMKNLYNALCELLRHFWGCFPATTPAQEEKAVKMRATLEKFQLTKLNIFRDKLQSYHYAVNLIGHMEEMLAAAYNKFNVWQQKKISKKS